MRKFLRLMMIEKITCVKKIFASILGIFDLEFEFRSELETFEKFDLRSETFEKFNLRSHIWTF
jgi:hypothetical protein